MNDQAEWRKDINQLKHKYGFYPDFDLVKHIQELRICTERRDSQRNELRKFSNELKDHEKKKTKKVRYLNKKLTELIGYPNAIAGIQKDIQDLTDATYTISMCQRYSKSKMYIARLCAIFYEGTGILPEVMSPKVKGKSSYRGNFYEFLLESQSLLTEIGIELIADDATLGKYAFEIVNGNKKEGVMSFSELQKELEIDKKEIEEIKKELFC